MGEISGRGRGRAIASFRQPDFTLIVKAGQMCRDGCQACENLVFATVGRNVTRPRNLSRYRLPHFPYRFPGILLYQEKVTIKAAIVNAPY